MFSRKLIFSLLVLAQPIFSGCSNNHNFIDPDTIVSLAYDTNCLDVLESDFKLYKQELLSDQKLTEDFKCLRDALDYIKLRVEGEEPGKFTSLEMKRFLNKVLFKEDPKSESFYKNLVAVKAQIFGGESAHISFEDFEKLKEFLNSTEETAKLLKPFASEIFFEKPFKGSQKVDVAVRSLVPFVSRWLKFSSGNINLSSVINLIEDAGFKIKSKNNWVSIFNLFREVSSEEPQILNTDKDKLIGAFQTYYSAALNLYRTLDKDWEYKREDFFDLSREVESALLNLEGTLKGHPDQKWSRADLVLFLNMVSDYEVFDQELSVSVRGHIVDVIFGKWFSNEKGTADLNLESFQKVKFSWNEIDTFIVDSKDFEGFQGVTFPSIKEGTSSFALFTQQRWPSLVRKDRTLFIPDFAPSVTFTFQSLFHVAWQFTAAKILVEAYTGDEERLLARTGLSLEEVKEAYLDVFVFLKEIGFLSEDSRGGWFRIFNEGNLFVPSAAPDGYVSISETADYAAYMFSAVFMGQNVSDTIGKACPNFVEKCSIPYLRKNPDLVFEALPGLVDFFSKGLKKKSFSRWQRGFEYIAKLDNNNENYEKSHWFRGTVANQYNEVLYRKYDTDSSDTLSFEEVSVAFVDFKAALKLLPQVKGTAAENDDAVLKSFLTLFVKKGRLPKLTPTGKPRGGLVRHVLICGSEQTSENKECKFQSDRSMIMALLAFLTSI